MTGHEGIIGTMLQFYNRIKHFRKLNTVNFLDHTAVIASHFSNLGN